MIEAIVKNYRQSPRKVRVVADLVRGKRVSHALTVLTVLNKKAADPIRGAIQTAVANAKHNFKLGPEYLFVKEIKVDEGVVIKRHMPRARGSVSPIKKRTSHIFVALDTKGDEVLTVRADHRGSREVAAIEEKGTSLR
jgi:large subunit ribosomal protein L22